MKTRMLRDIEVSEVGMGCMAFSHGYGRIPEEKYGGFGDVDADGILKKYLTPELYEILEM